MRRDLVAAALNDIRSELFADVDFTPVAGDARRIPKAISGVEIATDDLQPFGQAVRVGTHVTYAPAILFADIGKGAVLDELDDTGAVIGHYRVVDVKPWGDGRLELAISLVAA
jgi:hypothetical protein